MEKKLILQKDINANIDSLPIIGGTISSRDALTESIQYINLNEATYTYKESEALPYRVTASIHGDNFHEDLERLHKEVPQHTPEGTVDNPHDNYIYDTLKQTGVPPSNVISHLMDVIHMPELDNRNQFYLRNKWIPLIDRYAKQKPSIYSMPESEFNEDELKQIPKNMSPGTARVLSHKLSGAQFEFHPTEGFKYLGVKGGASPAVNPIAFHDTSEHKPDSHNLTSAYEAYRSEPVKQYTEESAGINRYHHFKHQKRTMPDTFMGIDHDEINEVSDGITNHFNSINHPTHLPDFTTYTGLHAEFNPRTDASHIDEHGNLIFHNPAFTSTTLIKHTGMDFARDKSDSNHKGMVVRDFMKIKVPGGYPHGAFIKHSSEHPDEEEYLLDKGNTFLLNPKPKYFMYKGMLHRQWDATLHPKEYPNVPYESMSNAMKINSFHEANASRENLEKGLKDINPTVRAAAAKHPTLSEHQMKIAALDPNIRVRQATMINPSLPNHMIDDTIKNGNIGSMIGLARRKELSPAHRSAIIAHNNNQVNELMAHRHDLSTEDAENIYNNHRDSHTIMKHLAENQHLHPDFLHRFVNGTHDIRVALAENKSIRRDTHETLSNDESYDVRYAARQNPRAYRP
jgi:ADP-ribosyltransferase exoenzyme